MTLYIHTHYTALYSSSNILTQVELSPARMFDEPSENVRAARGFIVWLRVWWDWVCGTSRAQEPSGSSVLPCAPLNREARHNVRRRAVKALPPARNFMPFFHYGRPIGGSGIRVKPRQFMERLARFSIWGRISIYGMRREGSLAQRRARLSCYNHGDWRAPVDAHYFLHLWQD